MTTLHFVCASYNRRNLTVQCVGDVLKQCLDAGVDHTFTLYDDGSSDGTADEIEARFSGVDVIRAEGGAFWARSMAEAERRALDQCPNDSQRSKHFIVWINDDVTLLPGAVARVLPGLKDAAVSVLVGAMRDPLSKKLTYSGLRKTGYHPLRFSMIEPPGTRLETCDTFNGNLVFVRATLAANLGGIDGNFSHALADFDYGLRCKRAGVGIFLHPEVLGECARNADPIYRSIRDEWSAFRSVKGGGEPRSLRRILQKEHRYTARLIVWATYTLWWLRRISRSISMPARLNGGTS